MTNTARSEVISDGSGFATEVITHLVNPSTGNRRIGVSRTRTGGSRRCHRLSNPTTFRRFATR